MHEINQTNGEGKTMEIKVLGPGCKRCQQTEQVVNQALQELGITANLDHVKDPIEISN